MAFLRLNETSFQWSKTDVVDFVLRTVSKETDFFRFFDIVRSAKSGQIIGSMVIGGASYTPIQDCENTPSKLKVATDTRKWEINCTEIYFKHCVGQNFCNILSKDYNIDLMPDSDLMFELELFLINTVIDNTLYLIQHRHAFLGNKDSVMQAGGDFSVTDGIFKQILPYVVNKTTGLIQSVSIANPTTYTALGSGDGILIIKNLYENHKKNREFKKLSKESKVILVTDGIYQQYYNDLVAMGCCNAPNGNDSINLVLTGLKYTGEYLTYENILVIPLDEQTDFWQDLHGVAGAEWAVLTVIKNLVWGQSESSLDGRHIVENIQKYDEMKRELTSRTTICIGFGFRNPEFISLALPQGSVFAVGNTTLTVADGILS